MLQNLKSFLFLALSLTVLGCLVPVTAKAQITPDNTLGNQNSRVTPGNIKGIPSDRIDEGATRGSNLFHSFREFNINAGRGAYFANPAGIENIFSRVTGNNISNILGRLGVLGNANLFFINPNGIFFGENASLDLRGSFFASTADSLIFDNGFEFSASDPTAPPLLTISIPIGANFRDNPGDITVNQSILEVNPGETFALVGGNLSIEGGELGFIAAPGGRIELGGLTAAGEVRINENNSLTFPDNVARGNVSLSNLALIDVSSDGEGSIAVNANNLELSGASSLEGGIASGLGSANAQAGDIILNATGEISLKQASAVFNRVNENAIGNSGNINIQTNSLTVLEESLFSASTFGQGNAGNINITATNDLVFGELTGAFSTVDIEGKAGNINVNANNISLTNGAQFNTATYGIGDAGDITVNASDTILLDEKAEDDSASSGFTAEITAEGIGNAGNIFVTTKNLSLTNGAQLSTINSGQGNAGNIFVDASDTISLDGEFQGIFGTGFYAGVQSGAIGNGGTIEVNTDSLAISNDANLTTTSQGQGNAGNIFVNATGGVTLKSQSSIDASMALEGQGNAGEITINTGKNISLDGSLTAITANLVFATGRGGKIKITGESLSLANGAFIDAGNTFSQGTGGNIQIDVNDSVSLQEGAFIASNSSGNGGDAGDITIQAGGNITLEGSSPLAQSRINTGTGGINLPGIIDTTDNTGKGGDINIISNSLILKNYANISAFTFGKGDAGNINIEVSDSVIGKGTLSLLISSTDGAGNAGKITINAGNSVFFDGIGSGVNTGTLTTGQGSDIEITTDSLTLSNLAALLTSTFGEGNAGNIQVDADSISLNSSAQIDSSTEAQGNAGNIQISANDSVILNEDTKLRSAAFPDSRGQAGNVEIQTRSLLVNNDAQVTVESQGEGNGGDLFIQADSLTLDRNGSINASTVSGTGGNINLQIADILSLSNNSKISAQALENANGGNITANAELIIAFPNQNNDIFANAAQGNGGNINITTQAIFGLEERRSVPPNQTNDIDASSQFGLQGGVEINTPDIDPTRGLIDLTQTVTDPEKQISQNPCEQTIGSEFIITGKGGIPPSPHDSLTSDAIRVDLVEPVVLGRRGDVGAHGVRPMDKVRSEEEKEEEDNDSSVPEEIVPAQGWIFNDKGQVMLTSYDPTKTGVQRSWQTPHTCPAQ